MKRAIFVLFFLLLPLCHGIGISNPKIEIDFVPNLEGTYSHTVSNARDVPIIVSLEASGDLAEYIVFEEKNFSMEPRSTKLVSYDLKLPENVMPGEHDIYVKFVDRNSHGTGTLAFQTAVGAKLVVDVPFPGYFATLDLEVPDVNEGEKLRYKAVIENHGKNDIKDAEASFYFRTLDGELVDKFTFDDISIGSLRSYTIDEAAAIYDRGEYTVEAVFDYKNKATAETNFVVGSYDIEVTNISNTLYAGQITPFRIDVASKYNGPIPAAYALIEINGQEHRSVEKTLGAFESSSFNVYIDDLTFEPGMTYPAEVTIVYDPEETSQKISLTAQKPAQTLIPGEVMTSPTTYLILIVLLLVILNLFVLFRKKR